MGRGIRDAEDHCAVLLLGSGLALSLVDPADLALFSPATRAQIDLSQQVADQIKGEGLGPVREAIKMFLERDDGLEGAVQPCHGRRGIRPRRPRVRCRRGPPEGLGTRRCRRPRRGREHLRNAAERRRQDRARLAPGGGGRLPARGRPRRRPGDHQAAKQANKNTLMPTVPLTPKPVKGKVSQAAAASEYLGDRYASSDEPAAGVRSMLDDLAFDADQERTDAAEAAMRELGLHLGFSATRPEKEAGKGPDGCWGLTPTQTPSSSSRPAPTATTPTSSSPRPTSSPARSPGTPR